jgi:hypothetical protein
MLMWLTGIKGMAIAAGVSAVLAFGGGWQVRDAFCDSAKAKAENRILVAQRDDALEQVRRHAANLADARKRQETAEKRESELDRKVEEYERELAKIPARPECRVTRDDLDRMRRGP